MSISASGPWFFVLLTVAALSAEPGGGAEADAARTTKGVLLLRSGQTIEGQIQRVADHYQVSTADEELRIRTSDVQCCCRDLNEVYQRKRAGVQPGNLQEHLQLAQWCQQRELFRAAADELAAATQIDPNHPMIAVLQRRLKLAAQKDEGPKPVSQPAAPTASVRELDDMIRGMPTGTVEQFVQVVQPILMNHCMTSGCHGAGSEGRLQLLRIPTGQIANRRVTERNLYAVLQCIDWDDPGQSELLRDAHSPHATVQTAAFTDRRVIQYRRLTEWVYRVTQKPIPGEAPESQSIIERAATNDGRRTTDDGENTTTARKPPVVRPSVQPAASTGAKRAGTPGPQDRKLTAAAKAANPLDPAIWRQQFPADTDGASAEPAIAPLPTPAARMLGK
ncbi:MAG: hypothetical protein ABSF26_26810 [Thermoguttaceae bacterium]|jgi:hypothetical protein